MARRSKSELRRLAPRLYLVTPREDAATLGRDLDQALAAADVAAVLLRLPPAGERALIDRVRAIAPMVQGKGAALILEGHPEIVARTGADGAHLVGIDAFTAAVAGLKPDRIAGAGGLRTRHDAMLAGERGADYVMFGDANGSEAAGRQAAGQRPLFDAILERIAWWAELFEPPCVGCAESLDEVAALATAGADFVALGAFVFSDSRGPSAIIQAAAELLTATEPVK
jgi:thiamine-phosphate pyrophosphorylase